MKKNKIVRFRIIMDIFFLAVIIASTILGLGATMIIYLTILLIIIVLYGLSKGRMCRIKDWKKFLSHVGSTILFFYWIVAVILRFFLGLSLALK